MTYWLVTAVDQDGNSGSDIVPENELGDFVQRQAESDKTVQITVRGAVVSRPQKKAK